MKDNHPTALSRPFLKRLIFLTILLFTVLFTVSFSFPHALLPDVGYYTSPFFETLTAWTARHLLHLQPPYTMALVSDSTGFYIHTALLLFISVLVAFIWLELKIRTNYNLLQIAFTIFLRYYLAIQLLAYGLNKLFKWQFYLPEPNTLYTPLGSLSPDMLYWSAMGVSRTYSLITGGLEVLAASLLLFRKTVFAGAAIASVALFNIILINISFDISVKLYALFLLFVSSLLLLPAIRILHAAFINRPYVDKSRPVFYRKLTGKIRRFYIPVKLLLLALILADAMAVYVHSGNYNDDTYPRPPLHGAYEVQSFSSNGNTVPPLLTDTLRWRRLFIHRRGYFIVQYMNDVMRDYKLAYDTASRYLFIREPGDTVDTELKYYTTDSSLQLKGFVQGDSLLVQLKKLDIRQLPALQPGFHWTIDP